MDKEVPTQAHLALTKLLAENLLYRAEGHRDTLILPPVSFEVWVEVVFTGAFLILAYFFRSALFFFSSNLKVCACLVLLLATFKSSREQCIGFTSISFIPPVLASLLEASQ